MAVAVRKRWELTSEHQQTGEETRHKEAIYAGPMGKDTTQVKQLEMGHTDEGG